MAIKTQVADLMKSSLKSGDKATLTFSRNLHAAIRKKEIDTREDLSDEGILKIIASLSKQRQESIEQFKSGGRQDLVEQEEAELKFLSQFLPTQLSDEELRNLVNSAITKAQASTAKEMGKVMPVAMEMAAGRADGKRLSQLVKELLQG